MKSLLDVISFSGIRLGEQRGLPQMIVLGLISVQFVLIRARFGEQCNVEVREKFPQFRQLSASTPTIKGLLVQLEQALLNFEETYKLLLKRITPGLCTALTTTTARDDFQHDNLNSGTLQLMYSQKFYDS